MIRQLYDWRQKFIGAAIALLCVCATPAEASCVNVDDFLAGTAYVVGDSVLHRGKKFECKVDGWCSDGAATAVLQYEPGRGLIWAQAWAEQGACIAANSSSSSGSNPGVSSGAAVPTSVHQGDRKSVV